MPEDAPAQDRPAEQEEWTRVKSKSKFRRAPRNTLPKTPTATATTDEPRDHKSVADIQSEFETFRTRWLDSDAHQKLANLIEAHETAHEPICKAICLGVGTFDMEDGGWDARRRTYIQLAAFLDMVELMSKASSKPIRCIFQEPRFTTNDKAFLESLGHEVAESPGAFEAVDKQSLLFAIHMYRPIYEAALATLPAMFVGTGWETWDDVGNLKEGDFQCMQDMHTSHTLLPFPQDDTYTTFSSTCLYWRPAAKPETVTAQEAESVDATLPVEATLKAESTGDGEEVKAKAQEKAQKHSAADDKVVGHSEAKDDAKDTTVAGTTS